MQTFVESNIEWLDLPPRKLGPPVPISFQYGAGDVAAKYCRLHFSPRGLHGHWLHGWSSKYDAFDPRRVIGETVRDPGTEPCWVARKDEEEYLRKHGYIARAIGLPIAYVPQRSYRRRPGSLLLMPAHSLDYTRHNWRFAEYADAIARIKSEFSSVVICVHPSCAKKGYWIPEFQRLGIPIILGADIGDRLSLVRMQALMSQFEFVSTNAWGSCIAYACAFGAKLSIYGPYCGYEAKDFENDAFYRQNPGLLEKLLPEMAEATLRKHWPTFFTHPAAAAERTEWGLHQIGFDNRISPDEMKRCFDWSDWKHAILWAPRRLLPQRLKPSIKRLLNWPVRKFTPKGCSGLEKKRECPNP